MRIVTITHPTGDALPILLDDNDLPIPSPNEFILADNESSINTLIRVLRELVVLFRWLDHQGIDIYSRIESKSEYFTEADIRRSLAKALRLKQKPTKGSTVTSVYTSNLRLMTIRRYFSWLFNIQLSKIIDTTHHYTQVNRHKEMVLDWLDMSFIKAPPSPKRKRKGLNTEEVKFLVNCLDPDNPNAIGLNPAVRFRNHISVMIMLDFGLRPGELLSLKVEDIVIGAISSINIVRRPPDVNDKRKPPPKIKRNGRVLIIHDFNLARSLDEYIMKYREELEEPSVVETEYLIISKVGDPLSYATLNQIFTTLKNKFPDDLPDHLTSKALRHTYSSSMERILRNAGLEEGKRSQALAELRGDSSLDSQEVYIGQEIEEQVQIAIKNHQLSMMKG